ncbi:transposase, IS4 family (plasmid) [Rhizorhabdus wittichii RW1]|uniref:Transposase, IS4 family n=2 Tax=Sphingomonadaceae TaxID=41297 RepID=A0A9J9LGH4_RHIWR|nr:transposase, IS4 family [Rhizorhabdus wittichii RW1]
MAMVDALGNLVRFVLMPGQRNDLMGVRPRIDGISFDALLADKAFDANWLRAAIFERGAKAVIPSRKNRKTQIDFDAEMYKWRHLVENYFAKIKEFRGIATRYDKTDDSFRANINLTATLIACR